MLGPSVLPYEFHIRDIAYPRRGKSERLALAEFALQIELVQVRSGALEKQRTLFNVNPNCIIHAKPNMQAPI